MYQFRLVDDNKCLTTNTDKPSAVLMNSNLLHLAPHVFFTCFAFFWWLLGLVMTQHKMRTSLCKRCASELFSCACASSWLPWLPTSFSGPSSFTKSPPVCGSRKSACWLSDSQFEFGGFDTKTTANEKPTNTPKARVNIERRLAIVREPMPFVCYSCGKEIQLK